MEAFYHYKKRISYAYMGVGLRNGSVWRCRYLYFFVPRVCIFSITYACIRYTSIVFLLYAVWSRYCLRRNFYKKADNDGVNGIRMWKFTKKSSLRQIFFLMHWNLLSFIQYGSKQLKIYLNAAANQYIIYWHISSTYSNISI